MIRGLCTFGAAGAFTSLGLAFRKSNQSTNHQLLQQEQQQQQQQQQQEFAFCADSYPSSGGAGASTSDDNRPSAVSFDVIRTGKEFGIKWCPDWDGMRTGADRTVRKQLLLIRHGQYRGEKSTHNDDERVLTELGQEQAKVTGEYLRRAIGSGQSELFTDNCIHSVASSNLTRAMQTCEGIISGYDEPNLNKFWTIDPKLAEVFPCRTEPPYAHKVKPESHNQVESAFRKYCHRPKAGHNHSNVEMIVCHGNVIRYFVCRALQLPPEAWLRFALGHCSITSVTVRGSGHVSVNAIGSVGHLPPHLQTISNVD